MFTIGYLLGAVIWTGIVFYVGRNWETLNSAGDVEAAYKNASDKFAGVKTAVAAEIASIEARLSALKSLI